jgi:hypothetical protein
MKMTVVWDVAPRSLRAYWRLEVLAASIVRAKKKPGVEVRGTGRTKGIVGGGLGEREGGNERRADHSLARNEAWDWEDGSSSEMRQARIFSFWPP